MKKYLVILTLIVLVSSCQDTFEAVEKNTFGSNYLPISKGREYVFKSDSVLYSNGGSIRDTVSSFIKEVIGDTLRTLDGQTEYLIDRYFKRNEADEWTPIRRWTASKNADIVTRTEENLKFVKLNIPITVGKRWNPNAYFDENQKVQIGNEVLVMYPSWRTNVKSINEPISVAGKEFSSILIEVTNLSSVIERRFVNEWYVDGIGLVRKEMIILDSDTSRPNDAWADKGHKGFMHNLQLISYK
jgi:hypothetical protein